MAYLWLKVSLCRLHFAFLVIDDQSHGSLVHVYMPMGHLDVLALGNNIDCRAPLSYQGAAVGRLQAAAVQPVSAAGTLGDQGAQVSCMKLQARLRSSALAVASPQAPIQPMPLMVSHNVRK